MTINYPVGTHHGKTLKNNTLRTGKNNQKGIIW